jgi:AraC-like DNA-binding protein
LLIAFVVLATSSLIHYRRLEEVTIEEVEKKGIESLQRAKSVFAAIHLWMLSTVREIRNNPSIDTLLTVPDPNDTAITRAMSAMNNALRYYRWIDSIYLYNRDSDLVVSTIAGVEERPYSDLDLMQFLLNPVRPEPYRYAPRAIRSDGVGPSGEIVSSANRTNVWTMVLDNVENRPADPSAWLVVNILEQQVRADFFSEFLPDAEQFFVMQKNGIVISHPDPSLFRLDISSRSLVGHIISRPEPEGAFELRFADAKRVVSYVTYEELDWYLVSVTPYDDFMAPVVQERRLSLAVFAGFTVLAGLLAFLFSRRLYSPIERLLGFVVRVKGQLPDEGGEQTRVSRGEIQFLSDMFERVADQATRLNRAQEHYETAHRQELFKQLLDGRLDSEYVLTSDTARLLRRDDWFAVVVIRLDNYARIVREFQNEEIRSIFQRLRSFVAEFVPYDHYFVDMGDDHGALILGLKDVPDDEDVMDTLTLQIGEMQKEFAARFQWSLTAGLSYLVQDFEDLSDAYQLGFDATKLRFRYGHGSIVRGDEIEETDSGETYSFPEEAVRLMLYNVRKGELATALDSLLEIFQEVTEYRYEDFSVVVQFIKYMSLKMLAGRGTTAATGQKDALRTVESIDAVETAAQAAEVFTQAYRLYTSSLAASHARETVILVEAIKTQVTDLIDDPNLSPDLIATRTRLSTNHVRRVFKGYTGISLSVFITRERIELCKRLLVGTDLTVKQIYRQAGFGNYSNFFTTFKRVTGQTPGDYRAAHTALS